MARPGAKAGSRSKARREPAKDKRAKTSGVSDAHAVRLAMRPIFTAAQRISLVGECIEQMLSLMQNLDRKLAANELKDCIRIALRTEQESPHSKPLLDFVCRFLIQQSKLEQNEDLTILDVVLKDVIVKGMQDQSVTVSLNSLLAVRRIMAAVNDISNAAYNALQNELVAQLSNKTATIRAAAAKALHRFQEISNDKDVVTCALQYHLKNDPDFKVRQAILMVIEPSSQSLGHILKRTRDVKDIVRKAAYHKVAERIHIKNLTIDQRLSVLRNGLNDRSPSVKKTVERVLVVNWLRGCNENVLELLSLLDTESDVKTVDQLLHLIFRSYMDQTKDGKTKLHLFVKQFQFQLLDSRKLLMKKPLTVENAFLWRSLAYFLKESNVNLDPLDADVEDKEADNYETEIDELFAKIELAKRAEEGAQKAVPESVASDATPEESRAGPTPPKKTCIAQVVEVDLLDFVLPQLPHFCYYIKKFAMKVAKTEFDELELADLDFVYEQLVQILLLIEVGDSAQELILRNSIREIISFNLNGKMTDVIGPLMHVAAKNLCKAPDILLHFTQELTQEIHNAIFEAHEEQEKVVEMEAQVQQRVWTPHEIQAIELSFAKVSVELESARDEMDEAIRDHRFLEAEDVKQRITRLEKERERYLNQRLEARGHALEPEPVSESVPSSQSQKQEPQIQDHPVELLKCLQIFSGCLEFGDFKVIESVIQSHVDNICFSGLLSECPDIRSTSVKILGNCCFISKAFAKKYFALMIQVIQHDVGAVSGMALKALFDMICEHGVAEIHETDPGRDNSGLSADRVPDGVDMGASSHSPDGTDAAEEFTDNLSKLILSQLKSPVEAIQYVAVKGVAKLLFLGRISSSVILSQLILMWYNPKSGLAIRQYLGCWFPLFAFADSRVRSSASGQLSFEEAFFPTLEKAIQMTEKDDEDREEDEFSITATTIDNMIGFVINLMTEAVQVRVAISVCHRILDQRRDQSEAGDDTASESGVKLNERYLIKSLTCLVIDTATDAQLKELQVLGQEIISKGIVSKTNMKKIVKFFERVETILSREANQLVSD